MKKLRTASLARDTLVRRPKLNLNLPLNSGAVHFTAETLRARRSNERQAILSQRHGEHGEFLFLGTLVASVSVDSDGTQST